MITPLPICADCHKRKRSTVRVRDEMVCTSCMDKRVKALLHPETPKKKVSKSTDIPLPAPYGSNPCGQTEAHVSAIVKEALEAEGLPFNRINVSGMTTHGRGKKPSGMCGMPDFIQWARVTRHIEVKKPDGKLSQEQHDFLLSVYRQGHHVAVVASVEGAARWRNGERSVADIEGWLPIW